MSLRVTSCALVLFLCFILHSVSVQMKINFYHETCPNAELIVRRVVEANVKASSVTAAELLRLQFHDCFFETASAHIITAVIGSGVFSLAWATAQLGWLAGPVVVMLLFSIVTYFTSTLLAACHRSGDPIYGKRNYTYMDVVRSNLGGVKVKLCGIVQFLNLFGVANGYTIASAISMMAMKRSNCFHKSGGKDPCHMNSNPYMIAFGLVQIIFSQIPDFDQLWWLSILAAVMSFTYSSAGLALGIVQIVGP